MSMTVKHFSSHAKQHLRMGCGEKLSLSDALLKCAQVKAKHKVMRKTPREVKQ